MELATEKDTDIIFYNGVIDRPCDEALIRECIRRGDRRRTNVLLILVTPGGNPDAAFRIARCLQQKYNRLSVYVPGICKSAGTLVAVGAHELIISDHGELGPLDIQMAKKDEFFESQSGLTVVTALEALEMRASSAVERIFMEFEANTGGMLSVQTATKLASDLVIGLYAPIAQQIDPLHLGESSRALLIADKYGTRLNHNGKNLSGPNALKALSTIYPSHGFVIDRDEASNLFHNVREPVGLEIELIDLMGTYGRRVRPSRQGTANPEEVLSFLTPIRELDDEINVEAAKGESDAYASDSSGDIATGPSAIAEAGNESTEGRRTAPG